MGDRDAVFGAIRKALEPLHERTAYPDWDPGEVVALHARGEGDLLACFREQITSARGCFLDGWPQLADFLREREALTGYIDEALLGESMDALAGFTLEHAMDRNTIDRYDFGITPASGAIAETGSVILRDSDCPFRLASLAPWVHVAVVRRKTLVRTLSEGVALFGTDPSVIFATGPSKTADIEGILIEGVHGPGVQACLLL